MKNFMGTSKGQGDFENILLKKLRGQGDAIAEMKKEILHSKQEDLKKRNGRRSQEMNTDILASLYAKLLQMDAKQEEICNFVEDMKDAKENIGKLDVERVAVKEFEDVDEICRHLDCRLIGYLAPLKNRIYVEEGRIIFENGISLCFKEFQLMVENFQCSTKNSRRWQHVLSTLQDPMWLLTPQDYEVQCCNSSCEEIFSLTGNIREDGVSVQCPDCDAVALLGHPMKGLGWKRVLPCGHFQQLEYYDIPRKCLICGNYANNSQDHFAQYARTPRRKQQ